MANTSEEARRQNVEPLLAGGSSSSRSAPILLHAELKGFQERNQRSPVSRSQPEAEVVTTDRADGAVKSLRLVILAETRRIEPLFQTCCRSLVAEGAAHPDPAQ